MTDKDEQDKVLEQKTNQVDPSDEITDDEGLEDETSTLDGHIIDLGMQIDDKDWVEALETADALQESINSIHAYISGKIK